MRISDWSSDVCSSDLLNSLTAPHPGRIVIFDSPPVLAASPASALASHVGQAVLVVRADKTTENALRDAVGLLHACDHIQLLLNGVQFSPEGRHFGTYYGGSEEHTSELQSLMRISYAVFCLKKKIKKKVN